MTVSASRQTQIADWWPQRVVWPVAANTTYYAGSMMADAGGIAAPVSAASGEKFIGVTETDSDIFALGTTAPYQFPSLTIIRRGKFRFFTTAGDQYTSGMQVYIGTDSQTVTSIATTNTAVGWVDPEQFVKLSLNNTTVSAINGGSGVLLDVWICPQFPTVTGAVAT